MAQSSEAVTHVVRARRNELRRPTSASMFGHVVVASTTAASDPATRGHGVTDHRFDHLDGGGCSSIPADAATAVLVSIRWDALTPTDLLAAGLALRLMRRFNPDAADGDVRFAEVIRAVEARFAAAAARWLDAIGHGPATATRCVLTAYDELAAVLQLSQCRCSDEQSDQVVLRATVFGLHASLTDFLGDHLADPRSFGNPGSAALVHLVRAHAQLLLATIIIGADRNE